MPGPSFTPFSALIGGSLIGLAASLLLAVNGRIAGISGILNGLLNPIRDDIAWRVWFTLGLLATGASAALLLPGAITVSPRSLGTLGLAGLLVGAGTRVAAGCTSGHGVCGLSRGSFRSLVATLVFVATGVLTATVAGLLGEGR